jgi:hypothetical protein
MSRLEVVILVASLILLGFIVEVVRRRRLSEGYALLWIAVGVGVLLMGVLRPLIDRVARLAGVSYGASLIFGVATVFLVVVCVNLSMHVSRLEEKVQTLAEEVALLHGPRTAAPVGPDDALRSEPDPRSASDPAPAPAPAPDRPPESSAPR